MMEKRGRCLNQLRMRGQSQSEFLIIFSMAVFLLVLLSVLYQGWSTSIAYKRSSFRAAEVANTVAFAVNNAYFSGNGTSINISIPSNAELSIVLDNITVTVNSSDQTSQSQIIAAPVNTSTIQPGIRMFYNNNGIIEVS